MSPSLVALAASAVLIDARLRAGQPVMHARFCFSVPCSICLFTPSFPFGIFLSLTSPGHILPAFSFSVFLSWHLLYASYFYDLCNIVSVPFAFILSLLLLTSSSSLSFLTSLCHPFHVLSSLLLALVLWPSSHLYSLCFCPFIHTFPLLLLCPLLSFVLSFHFSLPSSPPFPFPSSAP